MKKLFISYAVILTVFLSHRPSVCLYFVISYVLGVISVVVATGDNAAKKDGNLIFYKGEKINVFEQYVSPPYSKFWIGEVQGIKVIIVIISSTVC